MPGTSLDAKDTSVNKTNRVPALMESLSSGRGRKYAHKELRKLITEGNEDRKKQ